MSSVTSTITVNAAFLQEIKEDAREFRQLLTDAAEMLSNPRLSEVEPKCMVELFNRVRDQLALHFTLEEAYGYFEDALDAAPQLSETAETLRNQHQTLFADFGKIAEIAEDLLYGKVEDHQRARIARMYHNFRADLQQHESREHEMILAAFNDDIGCGD
jgi:hypothetical protein